MKKYIFICCLLFSTNCFSQLNIVPAPAEVKMGKGNCILSNKFIIRYYTDWESEIKNAKYLQTELKSWNLKCQLRSIQGLSHGEPSITLINYHSEKDDTLNKYELNISKNSITIYGSQKSLFSGIQTLLQLLSPNKKNLSIPQLSIMDYPRFPYRGMHLDVARHFFPVSVVKKYIDYLAAYKFNTFHWHLTDDQGWRIEIKKYPLLTKVGGYRNGTITGRYPGKGTDNTPHGGFYTQAQIKEIVAYAAEKYITVIPEIEMPGHASAAIAAYPQLSCFPNESTNTGNTPWTGSKIGKQVQQTWGVFEDVFAPTDYTFNFLQDVLDEVMPLFPSKYIHIGGDECPKEAWKKSPFCQELIKKNNLKDEHALQSYFINRIEKYLNSKGKNIIGWDEILEGGLAPNATVMSWRGEEGGIEAAKQNHNVIMTPGNPVYFDHTQSKNEDSVTIGGYNSLEAVYAYEPIPATLNEKQAKYVMGAQANLWTEYIHYPSKVEYMIFPRMIALSEVLWSPKEKRSWNDFERRLPVIFERLDRDKINYSKAYYDLKATVKPSANNNGIIFAISSLDKNTFIDAVGAFKNSRLQNDSILINDDGKTPGITKIVTKKKEYNSSKTNAEILVTENNPIQYVQSIDKKTFAQKAYVSQVFNFNKATGKKITLATEISKNYPGDGAFTLVNGVQNEKGMSRSSEFLGFSGNDLDATIDLGAITNVKKVTLHALAQPGSWIYLPSKVEVHYLLSDGTEKREMLGPTHIASVDVIQQTGNIKIEIPGNYSCRYVRVIAKNFGTIPTGNAGAGNSAWLFVDEIEVK